MGDDKKPVSQPTPTVGSETQPTSSGHRTNSDDKPRVTTEKPKTERK